MGVAAASEHPRLRVHPGRIVIGALVILVLGAGATLFGWDIGSWFRHIWSTITRVSLGYLLAAIALVTLQTVATAYAWYAILRFAHGREAVRWGQVLACYAAAVALNCVLPANLGTLAMLVMFTMIISSASLASVTAAYVVQKLFYTTIGIAGYVYLFSTVEGSFSLQFGFVRSHPVALAVLVLGTAALIVIAARRFRSRVKRWWDQAKDGGEILAHPSVFLRHVVLPEVTSWLAMLGTIAVFLAAYRIPVSFHTLMRVVGGNSLANMTSVTPGGAGVQQGFNTLSLKGVTSASNAAAYSVAQQLMTTAWSLTFAILVVAKVFGVTGGKALVWDSYADARRKRTEHAARRRSRRAASPAQGGKASDGPCD